MQVNIKDLSFSYRKKNVLSKLSCDFDSGEIVAILGVNGAGKSTLLKLMCGLLSLQHGRIDYDCHSLNQAVKKKLGVVFQDCSLDPKLTGRENLMLCAALYGVSLPQIEQEEIGAF